MTESRRTLAPLLQWSLGCAALAALVTACEARRPEPVAPVAILSVADGKSKTTDVPTGVAADSAKRELTSEIRARVPAPALNGSASDPLLIVYDADGNTVLSGRLGTHNANGTPALDSIPFPPEVIASVDVIKAGALLPPEAKGGLIKVVLKREAGPFKRMASPDAPPAPPTTEMLVVIRDSEGKEVYREQLSTPAGGGAPDKLDRLVDPAAIASVDVVKSPADREAGRAEIRITLKPGASLRAKR